MTGLLALEAEIPAAVLVGALADGVARLAAVVALDAAVAVAGQVAAAAARVAGLVRVTALPGLGAVLADVTRPTTPVALARPSINAVAIAVAATHGTIARGMASLAAPATRIVLQMSPGAIAANMTLF